MVLCFKWKEIHNYIKICVRIFSQYAILFVLLIFLMLKSNGYCRKYAVRYIQQSETKSLIIQASRVHPWQHSSVWSPLAFSRDPKAFVLFQCRYIEWLCLLKTVTAFIYSKTHLQTMRVISYSFVYVVLFYNGSQANSLVF